MEGVDVISGGIYSDVRLCYGMCDVTQCHVTSCDACHVMSCDVTMLCVMSCNIMLCDVCGSMHLHVIGAF